MQDDREDADYDAAAVFTEALSRQAFDRAHSFCADCERVIRERGYLP